MDATKTTTGTDSGKKITYKLTKIQAQEFDYICRGLELLQQSEENNEDITRISKNLNDLRESED